MLQFPSCIYCKQRLSEFASTLKMFILHSGFFSKVRRCKSWKLKIKWMVHHRPSSTFLLLFYYFTVLLFFFFFTVLLLTFISPLALNYFTLSREVAPCLFQLDLTITITSKTQIIHYADLDLVILLKKLDHGLVEII